MKKLEIETLLFQEMEEVKGGVSGVCICQTGAVQTAKDTCICERGALQTTKDDGGDDDGDDGDDD